MYCKHFGVCGGCSLPSVAYPQQLLNKQARLSRLLNCAVPPLLPSPLTEGFRSKASFVFGPAKQGRGLVMGHYAEGSKRIVPVDHCPVHSERGNRIAFALRDRLSAAGIAGAGAQRNGLARHLIIRSRSDEGEAVAMLVVTRNDKSLRTPVRALLESSDRPDGMFVNVHDQPGSQMVGPQTIKVDGRDHVRERGILRPDTGEPVSFLLSPNAFFQTNVGAARELVRLVAEGVAGATRVLDLYSGSGLFTIPLALAGVSVTAVEDNRQATADLSSNLRLNRMPEGRVRVIAATVEDALPRLRHTRWEAVILDPPRQGCSAAVIRSVFQEVKPPVAVMVSCNPEALASDLERIRLHGYRPVRIQAVDMFPHTDHIETVVVLHKT